VRRLMRGIGVTFSVSAAAAAVAVQPERAMLSERRHAENAVRCAALMRSTSPLPCRLIALACCAVAAGCGTRSTLVDGGDPTTPPEALLVYVRGEAGCVEELPGSEAEEALSPVDSSDTIAVADLAFGIECTNAGGDYVLAREIDDFRYFWLGAHACWFLDQGQAPQGPGLVFGVVRYRQTAALFQIPPEVCVAFGDEPPGLSTDATTEAIAVFETLEGAQAFAAGLGSPPP
jgi:hypothetical protein